MLAIVPVYRKVIGYVPDSTVCSNQMIDAAGDKGRMGGRSWQWRSGGPGRRLVQAGGGGRAARAVAADDHKTAQIVAERLGSPQKNPGD